jgi:beta-1,4-N-acetylglucosaminyltransferase
VFRNILGMGSQVEFHRIFLTVGTTEFIELISSIDNRRFICALKRCGCRSLVIQVGRGNFPSNLSQECAIQGILYDTFQFKPSLSDSMAAADLIISHCGAGSILEVRPLTPWQYFGLPLCAEVLISLVRQAIDLRKPLVVVVNNSLQGNHQTELSDALAAESHCLSTSPDNLIDTLEDIADGKIPLEMFTKQFPDADFDLFPALVDSVFGFDHTN